MLVLNVLIALATFSTTLTAALFVILQMEKRRRRNYGVKEADVPVLEAQDRADAIVKAAAEKARFSLLEAEKEGASLVAKYREVEQEIVLKYAEQLDEILKNTRAGLNAKSQEAEKTYEESLRSLAETVRGQISPKIEGSEKLYADYLKGLEEKANASLESSERAGVAAREKAEASYGQAERAYEDYLSGLKTKFGQIFEQNQKDIESLKAGLGTKITQTEQSYAKFLKSLEEAMTADFNKKQQALEIKVNEFFEGSQELLNRFLKELEGRTQTQVEQEIGNAKKLIDEYQKQRLAIIDENLVAILEKTLNITLGKKLTLADQTELVYEALEEAKKENFFA